MTCNKAQELQIFHTGVTERKKMGKKANLLKYFRWQKSKIAWSCSLTQVGIQTNQLITELTNFSYRGKKKRKKSEANAGTDSYSKGVLNVVMMLPK